METKKIIGGILILISLAIGYMGANKIAANTQEVNLLGLKIDASNESGKKEGYIYLGIAAILFVGGIYSLNKSKSQIL